MSSSVNSVRRLTIICGFYGAAALGSLGAGLGGVLFGVKPPTVYTGNPILWTKMGVWLLIALGSIIPIWRYIQCPECARNIRT